VDEGFWSVDRRLAPRGASHWVGRYDDVDGGTSDVQALFKLPGQSGNRPSRRSPAVPFPLLAFSSSGLFSFFSFFRSFVLFLLLAFYYFFLFFWQFPVPSAAVSRIRSRLVSEVALDRRGESRRRVGERARSRGRCLQAGPGGARGLLAMRGDESEWPRTATDHVRGRVGIRGSEGRKVNRMGKRRAGEGGHGFVIREGRGKARRRRSTLFASQVYTGATAWASGQAGPRLGQRIGCRC